MNPITGLLTALGVLTAVYLGGWTKAIRAARASGRGSDSHPTDARVPDAVQLAVGAITNFFDTLGIGSFATTTAIFRLRKMVPDRLIPGTLNVGHTLPTIAQAFIYTSVIPVDVLTLVRDDWRGRPRRVAGRGHRCRLVEAEGAVRDGLRALRGGGLLHDAESWSLPCRFGRHRCQRRAARGRGRGQLLPWRADVAGDRTLCPVHDSGQPPRHERADRVSNHDGFLRVPDACRQPVLHPRAALTA